METEVQEKTVKLSLRKGVFFPPWLLLVAMVVVSLTNGEAFMAGLNTVTNWILGNFAWAFNLTTLACVIPLSWYTFLRLERCVSGEARQSL